MKKINMIRTTKTIASVIGFLFLYGVHLSSDAYLIEENNEEPLIKSSITIGNSYSTLNGQSIKVHSWKAIKDKEVV